MNLSDFPTLKFYLGDWAEKNLSSGSNLGPDSVRSVFPLLKIRLVGLNFKRNIENDHMIIITSQITDNVRQE